MAASNVDNAGKGNNTGAIGNGYINSSGSIVNGNSGTIGNGYSNSGTIGNGSATHHNYGDTVHNMFIVLNICPWSGDDGDQDQDRAAAPMVPRVLGFLGVATSSIAAGATAYKYNRPPRGAGNGNRARDLAYLVGIVVVFLAGLAEVGAAFWVSVDNRNRYGASRKIMRAAIVVLVLAVGLGGFSIVFNN